MDIVTTILFAGVVVVLAVRVVQLAVAHPEAFVELLDGARPFAERALADAAALSAAQTTEREAPREQGEERRALAA